EGVPGQFHVLDPLHDPAQGPAVAGQVHAELLGLQLHRGASGHVGDQHAHVVADQGRVDVLVQVRVDLDGGGVQPGLVREGGDADVGLVGGRGDVGDLGDGLGDPGHLAQAAPGQHAAAVLEDQGGDHREQV